MSGTRPGTARRPRIDETAVAAVRAAALVRVVVAVTAALAGLVGVRWWDGSVAVLFLLVGLCWLPWTVFLLAASSAPPGRRRHLRLVMYGGPLGDALIVFAAQCMVPWAWGVFLLADAVVVSVAASLWRARDAWLILGFVVGLTLLAQGIVATQDRLAVGLLVIVALAMAGLVVIVGRIAAEHRTTAVNSHRFQQKAETILARVADGIVVTDGFGVVLECNPAGERLIGNHGRSAVGVPCSQALGLREGERALDCSSGCPLLAAAGDDGPGREVWRELPDGRRQPLLASAFAVTDEQGVEVVHSLRDITRLKEADEAKTLFLATASHELKTPVTVIAGFAETILRFPDMPDERRAQAVEAIRRRALELSSIVDRLLLSSKIEGGRVKVDLHAVDVRGLLVERANALQDAAGRHVIMQVAPGALVAEADPLALRTVVDHLLDNAVKYSDGGPVVVGGHGDADAVVISVSDIGIGMDEEQATHCFDKFWQAESTDVRRFGGTGIGLYIVSSLVDAMGGTISVDTAVGHGSTFTVSLPAVSGPDPVVHEAAGLEDLAGDQSGIKDFMRQIGVLSRGGDMSNARALVVDDAADIRLLADLVLTMAGFTVTAASSGSEALRLLGSAADLPDIVLLDVQMPDVDGWETLSRLRQHPRTAELPVVLCTVKGLPEDALRGWTLGCDGYLGKPFDIGGLVEELENVLARTGQQRQAMRRRRINELAARAEERTRLTS